MERRDFLKASAALTLTLSVDRAWAQSAKTEVLWLGHSATRITSPGGKVIVIDPFITKNPKTPAQWKNLDALGHVDVILITHGHGDHTGDLAELAKRTNAKVAGPGDLISTMMSLEWVPADQAIRFHNSGTITPAGPQIKITQVRALHSSDITITDPVTKKVTVYPGGEAAGFIVELESGFKVYHMGDTGLFGDMRLISEYYKPDLVMIPIGGHFVMSPHDAAYATREMLKPRYALPIHYGTIPALKGTPEEYEAALGQTPTKVFPLSPGEKVTF